MRGISLTGGESCGIIHRSDYCGSLGPGPGSGPSAGYGACMKKILNRETVTYLIFGVLTTLVNYFFFWLGIKLFGEAYTLLINVFCFLIAASFAYVTNKLFVFESKSWRWQVLRREIPSFFGARLFSFLLEEAGLWVSTDLIHAGRYELLGINGIMIAKVLLSFLVVVLNYVFSKLFIFRQDREEPHESKKTAGEGGNGEKIG